MDSTAPRRQTADSAYAWYILALLFLVYVMNMADRQLVGILAEPIKRDLRLSDGEIGILAGPAIAFFYAILGLPMGYVSDRVSRVRFLSLCLAVWSAMTIVGGRVATFIPLAATRVGVSIGEAGGSPAAVSLLADYFRPQRRASAMAIWTAGSTAGVFVGFALGGAVNAALGWRGTFLVAGIPGLVLAALILLSVTEPARGAADENPAAAQAAAPMGFLQGIAFLSKIRTYRQVVLASAGCNFCVFGVLAWVPAFVQRSFGVGTAEAGAVIGTGILLAGGGSMILAGFVSDRLSRRGLHWPLRAVAMCLFLSALLFYLAFAAPDFRHFATFFTLAYAALMTFPAITWAIVQDSSPPRMRAVAAAIFLLVTNLLSSVPAPMLIGYLSDALRLRFGSGSLGIALLVVPAAATVAAIQYLRVASSARRAAGEKGPPVRPELAVAYPASFEGG